MPENSLQSLPPALTARLSRPGVMEAIVNRLETARGVPVTIDELLVAIYRETEHISTRASVRTTLSLLKKRGQVVSAGRGRYRIGNDGA